MAERPFARGRSKSAYEQGPYVRLSVDSEWTPEQCESLIVLATIAHLLFPENTPEPISAWIDMHTRKPNLLFEKIQHDQWHARVQHLQKSIVSWLFTKEGRGARKYVATLSISREYKEIKEKFFNAGLFYDISPHNLIRHPNGKLIMVDFLPAFIVFKHPTRGEISNTNFDAVKLLTAINSLKGSSRQIALSCYQRLKKIAPASLSPQLPSHNITIGT